MTGGGLQMNISTCMRVALAAVLCAALLVGCGGDPRLRIVCVIDLSSSIEADARAQAFSALQEMFAERRLRRGDAVVVIPVTNDSAAEAQGHVLRFEVSEKRSAYDSDLKGLLAEVSRSLDAMRDESAARPSAHSDYFGAVRLAEEEVARGAKRGDKKVVVLLGDFIQDTPSCDFGSSPQLASDDDARRYASSLTEGHDRGFDGAKVYLGLLRSVDLKRMPQGRRDAIQAFWRAYFQREGASSVSVATDGPRQLAVAAQESQQKQP
jgi:hypothetical protein